MSVPKPEYYCRPRTDLVGLSQNRAVPVLELGCGAGATAELLLQRGVASHVDGIELLPEVAELAGKRMRSITVGDIEKIDLGEAVEGKGYRTVVCGDVLEHLVDPWAVLENLSNHLDSGTEVLISLPNIRNLRVLVPLLVKGEFRYRPQGILDKTHLRFFTYASMRELIEGAGLRIDFEIRQYAGAVRHKKLTHISRLFGRLLVDQYVFRCEKA